jgi:hypothetical protein
MDDDKTYPCYCGWEGLDDSGCSCVHPELREEEEDD